MKIGGSKWLTPEDKDSCLRIPDYTFFRADSPSGKRIHGVGIFVKKNIPALRQRCELPNVLVIKLVHIDAHIVLIYRPPHVDTQLFSHLNAFFRQLHSSSKELCILGDLNFPGLTWNELSTTRGATPHEREYYDIFGDMGLTQIVKFPTFISSGNILDLVFLTDEGRHANLRFSQPFPKCGHVIISFDFLYNNDDSSQEVERFDWSRGDYRAMNDSLFETDWDFEFSHLRFSDKCLKFCDIYVENVQTYVPPMSNRRRNGAPWLKRVPKRLAQNKTATWKSLLKSRSHGRRSQEYKSALRSYRNSSTEYDSACLSERNKYEYSLLGRPKAFHSYIRKGRKTRPSTGPLTLPGTEDLVTKPASMSELFADSYEHRERREIIRPRMLFVGAPKHT